MALLWIIYVALLHFVIRGFGSVFGVTQNNGTFKALPYCIFLNVEIASSPLDLNRLNAVVAVKLRCSLGARVLFVSLGHLLLHVIVTNLSQSTA